MSGYCSKSDRKTESSRLHRATETTERGPNARTSCAEKNACPIRYMFKRLAFVCTTITSLSSSVTSDCRAMRCSPSLTMTPSSKRGPQVAESRTATNSSTSVPPTCCQYQRVMGVSCLLTGFARRYGSTSQLAEHAGVEALPGVHLRREVADPRLLVLAGGIEGGVVGEAALLGHRVEHRLAFLGRAAVNHRE